MIWAALTLVVFAIACAAPQVPIATSTPEPVPAASSDAAVVIITPRSATALSPRATSTPEPTVTIDLVSSPKNIILLIGDGMGFAHIDASRIWKHGPDGKLALDDLPSWGVVTTYSTDDAVTDSAAAATAIATGRKTNNEFVSLSPDGGSAFETILEQAETLGKATGIVVTSTVTHATPAAFYAHVADCNQQNLIAVQALESGIDLMFGGGVRHFIPTEVSLAMSAGECLGRRTDGRDLISEAESNGYSVTTDGDFLANVSLPVLGLFACNGMNFDLERQPDEPSLSEMTRRAIDLLSESGEGFFLMVEGSRIDQASHSNDPSQTIGETLAFDEAVRVVLEFAMSDGETLVIATADHETGGLQAEIASSSAPTKNGTQMLPLEHSPKSVLLLSWSDTDHTSREVPLMAFGPLAEQVTEAHDNTDVFRIMANAWGIEAVVVAVPSARPTPTSTPAPSLSELCTPVEPFASGRNNIHSNNDGVLKIGLTGHANLWWQGETLAGDTNVERARLIGEFLNSQQVDFSMWLGDDFRICDQAQGRDYARSVEGFEQAVYKLVGNHDLDENHGELIDPLQRERYAALFSHDIYWYVDIQNYRLVFLADESGQGASYVSEEQIAFLNATLDSSPHPVIVFAHHVLPIRSRELINAMIGKQSLNTNKILNIVYESGKGVFWGWGQHHSKGRSPIQANGIVEYTPHFLTGYVDGGAVNSLETSVLTLSDDMLTIEVFDTFTSTRTQFFSFDLPEQAN